MGVPPAPDPQLKPQKPFPKDNNEQACLDSFYNTDLGAVTKFFSPINLFTDTFNALPEWTLVPGGKTLITMGARQLSSDVGSTEFLSLTGGANVTIEGATAAGIDSLAPLTPIGLLVIPVATAMDAGVLNTCRMTPKLRFFAP